MSHKSHTRSLIFSFIKLIETQFSSKVKIIRSDNGSEFNMQSFFVDNDIVHQRSCIATPQQNGIVECKY